MLIHQLLLKKKVDLISLKLDVGKLDTDKSNADPTHLNNLRAHVNKLNFSKLQTSPVDLKKFVGVLYNSDVKKVFNILVLRVNGL